MKSITLQNNDQQSKINKIILASTYYNVHFNYIIFF